MSDSSAAPSVSPAPVAMHRPWAITVICVLSLIGAPAAIWILSSGIAEQIGPWYPPYLAGASIVGAICLLGFWKMRRWGVVLYTVLALINQVVLLVAGRWNALAIILPGIVVAIGFGYFSRMR